MSCARSSSDGHFTGRDHRIGVSHISSSSSMQRSGGMPRGASASTSAYWA